MSERKRKKTVSAKKQSVTKRNNTPTGEMNHLEFRHALAELGLTWEQAEEHIGIARRTIAHYLAGDSPVPAPVARLVKLWLEIARSRGRVRLPFDVTAK